MRKISVALAQPGMTVGKDVYGADGQLLLASQVILNDQYIRRLHELDVAAIYIHNPLMEDVEIPETIKDETRVRAIRAVQESFAEFRLKKKMKVKAFERVVTRIVTELLSAPEALVHMTDIRRYDDYTFGHSVNVCILAVVTARSMGYNEEQIKTLAMGALLHDVGKMLVPQEILNKPDGLDEAEWQVMQEHAENGFNLLRKQGEVPLLSAHVAFQHHERLDGSGYPRKLQGDEIHEYAKIVAISDTYDALTSERAYCPSVRPHEAYEIMVAEADLRFDKDILFNFLSHIALYPVGSMVKLNTGDVGIVVEVRPGLQTRPVVRLVADGGGRPYPDKVMIDMAVQLTVFIDQVLSDSEALKYIVADGGLG